MALTLTIDYTKGEISLDISFNVTNKTRTYIQYYFQKNLWLGLALSHNEKRGLKQYKLKF